MQMSNEMEFPPIGEYLHRYRRQIVIVLLLILVVAEIKSVFYSVEANSEAVVLRFGKYVGPPRPPGLHFKLPWPVETVTIVPVMKIHSLEFGYQTITPGQVTRYSRPTKEDEIVARQLTGDLNLVDVKWNVLYKIKDARDYLFEIGSKTRPRQAISDTIRVVSEAVMRRLVGDASVDEVITIGREKIAADAKKEIQDMLDIFHAGITIDTVKLKSATPPEAVKDAFDAVSRARANKERVINEAKGKANSRIPAARGERDRAISEAKGYAERVVPAMKGRVNAYLAQLAEYEKAPEITRTRLYLETMEEIFSEVDSKLIIDESIRGLLPLLNLNPQIPSTGRKGGAR